MCGAPPRLPAPAAARVVAALQLGTGGRAPDVAGRQLSHSDAAGAEATAAEIRRAGRAGAFPVQVDALPAAQVDADVRAGLAEFGRLDILVNNAGIQT